MSAAGPFKTAQLRSASGGSEAASAASVGVHMSAAGPSQGANYAPSGGSEAASAASVGVHMSAAGPFKTAQLRSASGGSAAAKPQAWGRI
jgi:hypothetical protein